MGHKWLKSGIFMQKSPEKCSENRLIQEILIRDSEGVIEAEIFPDYQKMIDAYNQKAPLYKRVFKIKIRETEFEKIQPKKSNVIK